MFAQSEQVTSVGTGGRPLFVKHVPLPATHSGTAATDIKQYQVVVFDTLSGEVIVATDTGSGGMPLPAALLGVAAYPAKAGEKVTFYTHGTINVDVVDISALPPLFGADSKARMMRLNTFASPTLFFDVAASNITHLD